MTSKERVILALNKKSVDRVPWIEGIVGDDIASKICEERINVDWSVAPDGTPIKSGPIFSPDFYEKEILPVERRVTEKINIPLIIHSDGNMNPLLDLWIQLKPNAIHPIQPDVMDIYEVREKLPENIGIVGNIDMDLLVHGMPKEVEDLVKERMERLKPTGNYLISSSNSLTDDMKPDNVKAMILAIKKYGKYKK